MNLMGVYEGNTRPIQDIYKTYTRHIWMDMGQKKSEGVSRRPHPANNEPLIYDESRKVSATIR
jgi:hypothetical protein